MAGLGSQLTRLGRQSIIYGAGGLIQRVLAVILLPIYTRYLTPSDYGTVETLIALTTVLVIVLRLGISTAFIRFYFDSKDPERRRLVLRTSFWFTMTMATIGLVLGLALSPEIASGLFGSSGEALVVAAAFVGLWAQMNWEQMLALFRVEERAVAFVSATLVNIGVTIAATLTLVVALDKGALGVIVGNFTGTLVVYVLLLGYRREQLGLQVDRDLLRAMNRYGLPLVPSALMLWVTNFSDRFLLLKLADSAEVGLYSVGVRVASAMALLLTAFRMSWPPFAYSIEDDREAKATYSFVLTYVMTFMTWIATGLTLLSPWLVDLIAAPSFSRSSDVVGPLAFSVVLFSGYVVVAIGLGRTKRTQFNWVVTGAAAIVNVGLNVTLIPRYGMMAAAFATLAAYATMFVGMVWWARRVFPVSWQWRRVVTAVGIGVATVAVGKLAGAGLVVAVVLSLAYPLVLGLTGFYLPVERRKMLARLRPAR